MGKALYLPPKKFKPAGVVDWVRHSPVQPPFISPAKRRGRRAAGIRYENKVHGHFADLYGDYYVPSPWFQFREVGNDRLRWCQPDGLLFMPLEGKIIIVECKLQHTSDAWWQLRWLYLPVVAKAFPATFWDYGLCEVVKWFDPAVAFPEKVQMRENVADAGNNRIGCHIWKS